MSSRVDLKEFVSGFILEADEHLHSVNRNLVATSEALKQGRPEPRAVRELFRSLHTIKGLASMVGAEPIVDLAHEMEGILRTADRAGGRLSERALDLLLQGTRAVEERVRLVSKAGIADLPKAPAQLLEALALEQGIGTGAGVVPQAKVELPEELDRSLSAADREQVLQAAQSGRRVVVIEFQPSPERAAQGFNITSVRERIGKLGELIKVVPRSSTVAPTGISFSLLLATAAKDDELAQAAGTEQNAVREILLATPALETSAEADLASATASAIAYPQGASQGDEWVPSDHSSIRVDIRRLDEALERLSALVVTRSKFARVAAELASRGVDARELNSVIAEYTRQLRRLRSAITEARMVPLSELLQRLPLVVRGITQGTDKVVNVNLQAGTAEVDKAVADKIFPAIIHLVRNAVDHALEPKGERGQAGKPEAGTISVVCDDSSGTSLIVTIQDDGRGINREAVARKAGRPVAKNDEELFEQIATPGLSTREDVTHTSGRGMGMDIVKRTVEMLGGTISLSTTSGKGTAFTLRVPVSITIVDVLSFVSGGQVFVAPVAMIDEIIEVDPAQMVKSPAVTGQGPEPRLIQRRGEAIPFLRLDALLERRAQDGASPKALVVNQNRGAIAFGVDRMLGQQEVVVRPLDDALIRVTGMSGATDLGDGRPTIVLDLATLGTAVMQNKGSSL